MIVNPDGTVYISGNLDISGTLRARGGIQTDWIRSLNGDLSIDLTSGDATNTAQLATSSGVLAQSATASGSLGTIAKLSILGATNEAVATIDASGSAQFATEIQSPQVTTDKLSINTGNLDASVGTGVLLRGTRRLTVYTNKVTANSLIFITPTTVTDRTIAVTQKISPVAGTNGSFTVELAAIAASDIQFSWFIVN